MNDVRTFHFLLAKLISLSLGLMVSHPPFPLLLSTAIQPTLLMLHSLIGSDHHFAITLRGFMAMDRKRRRETNNLISPTKNNLNTSKLMSTPTGKKLYCSVSSNSMEQAHWPMNQMHIFATFGSKKTNKLTINDETLPEVMHHEDDHDDGDHDADEEWHEDRGVGEERPGVLRVNYELRGDRGCGARDREAK